MDNTITIKGTVKYSAVIISCFVISAVLFALCGIKYSEIIVQNASSSFYGRYDGVKVSFLSHIVSAVSLSVPFLVQTLSLYLFSYSPMSIPAGMYVIGFRSFIAGIAYNSVGSADDIVQLIFYVIITVILCMMSVFFVLCGRHNYGIQSILKKTRILFITAGISVILETVLSYII